MAKFFKDIIGQESAMAKLVSGHQNNRFPHALMLVSENGSSALPLAMALGRYLHCEQAQEDACGTCKSCKQWDVLGHPDVHFTYPIAKQDKVSKSKDVFQTWKDKILENPYLLPEDWSVALGAETKKLEIHKDEAVALHHDMSMKSYQGGVKVCVIWRPELFNISSANLLLKLIEEPAPKTHFIFVTAQPDDVLTTIISRTQIFNLRNPEVNVLAQWLSEKKNISLDLAQTCAAAVNGNVRKAEVLVDNSDSNQFQVFRDWMRMCFRAEVENIQNWSEEMGKMSRENMNSFLQYCLSTLRNCIWQMHVGDNKFLVNEEEKKFVANFSSAIQQNSPIILKSHFEHAIDDIMWNGNGRIIFNDLSFKVMKTIRKK